MTKNTIFMGTSIVVVVAILAFTFYWLNTADIREIKKFCYQKHIVLKSGTSDTKKLDYLDCVRKNIIVLKRSVVK